jgi:hypothetical protein
MGQEQLTPGPVKPAAVRSAAVRTEPGGGCIVGLCPAAIGRKARVTKVAIMLGVDVMTLG